MNEEEALKVDVQKTIINQNFFGFEKKANDVFLGEIHNTIHLYSFLKDRRSCDL